MSLSEQSSGKFNRRQLRGFGILARGGQILKLNDGLYKVKSQASDSTYNVVWAAEKWSCNCPDYSRRLKPCKHIHAVTFMMRLPDILAANATTVMSSTKLRSPDTHVKG